MKNPPMVFDRVVCRITRVSVRETRTGEGSVKASRRFQFQSIWVKCGGGKQGWLFVVFSSEMKADGRAFPDGPLGVCGGEERKEKRASSDQKRGGQISHQMTDSTPPVTPKTFSKFDILIATFLCKGRLCAQLCRQLFLHLSLSLFFFLSFYKVTLEAESTKLAARVANSLLATSCLFKSLELRECYKSLGRRRVRINSRNTAEQSEQYGKIGNKSTTDAGPQPPSCSLVKDLTSS